MDRLLLLSGTRLAEMIRRREVSSLDVVNAHVAWVERVNPTINAVVQDRFDRARDEAREADRALARGDADLPPFHGVPCTIKECFALAGMPNSSGLVARRAIRSVVDATAVARLRKAGAIPLGVTNVSELCMWMETNNRVYGRTNNPYRPSRIVGGSSGGEGAIIGAGASPFGLGSDIGGSIRMPAFFNGVFGHKPTGGLVPGTGQFPFATGEARRYLTTGPLARRAEDLMPLLRILAGADGTDTGCTEFELGDPATVQLSRLRVLDVRGNGIQRVARELLNAQARVAEHLRGLGARVQETTLEGVEHSIEMWGSMLGAAGGPSFAELLSEERKRFRPLRELVRWSLRSSPHTLPAILLTLVEKVPKLDPERSKRFVEKGRALRSSLEEKLGRDGVILFPSYTRPAPQHVLPMLTSMFDWVYTAIWNVMGFPATQVPLGLGRDGVPLGVQVVAAPGNDHVTIAVALELERAFGGWVRPRTFEMTR